MPNHPAKGRPSKKKRPTSPPKSRASGRSGNGQRVSAGSPSPRAQGSSEGRPTVGGGAGGKLWLYGRHAVEAALLNPRRTSHQLLATDEALERLLPKARGRAQEIRRVERADLDQKLGEHVVHQGLALSVAPLPSLSLEKALTNETNLRTKSSQWRRHHRHGAGVGSDQRSP